MDTNHTTSLYQPPTDRRLDIIHVDDALIILNKPGGLLSVPGRGPEKQDSLSTRVQTQYPEALIVHRLDMATSGLMLMALTKNMQRQLSQLFEHRQIEKHYHAVVNGQLHSPKGEINLPMNRDWPRRPRQKIDHEHGKPSITRYEVLKYDARKNTSLLKVMPITGRSHQIRVHLQTLGHPILGDRLYADCDTIEKSDRLMLHASYLAFKHPGTNDCLEFDSPAPF